MDDWMYQWELHYTMDDDGVWLSHRKCDAEVNLGFHEDATRAAAISAAATHRCIEKGP